MATNLTVPQLSMPKSSPHTPLWHTPYLQYFFEIPDTAIGTTRGIKTLDDIVQANILLTFDEMKEQSNLPNSLLFRNLQICHTFVVQFGSLGLETKSYKSAHT